VEYLEECAGKGCKDSQAKLDSIRQILAGGSEEAKAR
jgi:hypothetical protein